MEPRIQYAKTSDGVSIAFWSLGEGVPLLVPPVIFAGHLQAEWEVPYRRMMYEQTAERARVVHYDCRGTGMSQRDAVDFSMEAAALDLEAVTDRVGFSRFAMFIHDHAGEAPLSYAALHPDRVTHVIYWVSGFREPSAVRDRREAEIEHLLEEDWDFYVDVWARLRLGWTNTAAASFADSIRRTHSPASFRAAVSALDEHSRENFLSGIRAPSLVLHQHGLTRAEIRARSIGAVLENSQILGIRVPEGGSLLGEEGATALLDFIDQPSPTSAPSGTAVILFADIADSTALTESLGDAAFRAKARDLDAALRTVIREHAGTPIEGKLLGDGVLATFTSARQAIEAALACARSGDEAGLPLHLGLHAGDVIREDNNVFGGAVNIAARVCGAGGARRSARVGDVRSLARTSAGVRFEDRGEQRDEGRGRAGARVGGAGGRSDGAAHRYATDERLAVQHRLSTLGQGPPLVILPTMWLDDICNSTGMPESRALYEGLARGLAGIVRYDCRGSGSQSGNDGLLARGRAWTI